MEKTFTALLNQVNNLNLNTHNMCGELNTSIEQQQAGLDQTNLKFRQLHEIDDKLAQDIKSLQFDLDTFKVKIEEQDSQVKSCIALGNKQADQLRKLFCDDEDGDGVDKGPIKKLEKQLNFSIKQIEDIKKVNLPEMQKKLDTKIHNEVVQLKNHVDKKVK